MAKKSVNARASQRARMVKFQGRKRDRIKTQLKAEYAKETPNFERVDELNTKLNKLPRNSSKIRIKRRCNCCGRPRAVYRRFGLCRICLRKHLMQGDVSGGRKSSW